MNSVGTKTKMGELQRRSPATILLSLSHALTYVAGLYMAFGPVYRGVEVTPVIPGNPPGDVVRTSWLSLIEANGVWVVWLMIVPIVITAAALLAQKMMKTKGLSSKTSLWLCVALLALFSAGGVFTIGIFYIPSLALLIAAAIVESRKGGKEKAGSDPPL